MLRIERAASPKLLLLLIVGWVGQNQAKKFWCNNWLTKLKNGTPFLLVIHSSIFNIFLFFFFKTFLKPF